MNGETCCFSVHHIDRIYMAADYIDHAVLSERKCSSIYVVCMSIVLTIINPMKYYIHSTCSSLYTTPFCVQNACMLFKVAEVLNFLTCISEDCHLMRSPHYHVEFTSRHLLPEV